MKPTFMDKQVTEAAFTAQVIALATTRGWKTAHFRAAQNRRGEWSTPVQGDGKGFPDLTLVRNADRMAHVEVGNPSGPFEARLPELATSDRAGGRLIFAELKAEGKYTEKAQRPWLAQLALIPGVEVYVWRPSDWHELAEVLK